MLINVQIGEVQPLQILDAKGKEITAESWSVDSTDLADIKEESRHAILHPKTAGVVRVTATIEGKTLTEEIRIWRLDAGMRISGPLWAVPSTGRELAALQAVPSIDGPDLFTLDRSDGGYFVRGLTNRGLQIWIWNVPESDGDVELLCGENLGGAIVTVTRRDSYTVLVVGQDGNLRWRRKFDGVRKGYAVNASNLLHLLSRSVDGASATISGWDAATGTEKFKLKIPASYEQEVNVRRSGENLVCAPGRSASRALATDTSSLFVNTDGQAYAAFTEKHWIVETDQCVAGSTVDPRKTYMSHDDQLVLWGIQPEGSHRDTVVEGTKQTHLTSTATLMSVSSPTGDIIPDGFGGVLLSVRSTAATVPQKAPGEFVYRVTDGGELAYKLPLPAYQGPLHDEMVLGEQELGFATRGEALIAFNVRDGNEVWRWDSGIPELKINMATAGGGCLVDTPDGLVLVEDGVKKGILAPHNSDMYTAGMFIQDDPHGVVMMGAGIKRD